MDAIVAKVIAVVSLLILTLFFGTLPYCLLLRQRPTENQYTRQRREAIIKFFNCFAGGVFLGALLLDLMVEAAETFEDYKKEIGYDNDYPFFNVLVIIGFFLVATVEYLAHSCLSPHSEQHPSSETSSPAEKEESQHLENEGSKSYGSMTDTKSLMAHPEHLHDSNCFAKEAVNSGELNNGIGGDIDHQTEDSNVLMPGVAFPATNSNNSSFRTLQLRSFLLLLALSFHSIFDGLALGLQETVPKIWQIFAAVGLHKCVVSFCLGLDIFENSSQPKTAAAWMGIFATISPIGACIGISITSSGINEVAHLLSSSILQGLACGAFLYVTFLEILNSCWKSTSESDRSFLDIISAFFGFTIMAIVKIWD